MATMTLHRHINGVQAQFSARYELHTLNVNANIKLTNQISVKVDANSILILNYPAGHTLHETKQYTKGRIMTAWEGNLDEGRMWHENLMIRY